MKEVLRTNDPILLSWAEAVLAEAGLDPILFDQHASVIEGSINAIERRIMVPDEQEGRARALLDEARREHG